MEERNMPVPYLVHEGILVRLERSNRRLVYALIMAILLIFASNLMWLFFWNQYDYESEDSLTTITRTVDVDAKEGVASYIGGSGNIINGKDSSYDDSGESVEKAETEEKEWSE